MLRRIIALTSAACLLAVGVAACGNSPRQSSAVPAPITSSTPSAPSTPSPSTSPTAAASPTPAASPAAPDVASCNEGKILADNVALRMNPIRQAMEKEAKQLSIDLVRSIADTVTQAKTRITNPRVKAVADEYSASLAQLKGQLEAYRGDRSEILRNIDEANGTLTKTTQNLMAICAVTDARV